MKIQPITLIVFLVAIILVSIFLFQKPVESKFSATTQPTSIQQITPIRSTESKFLPIKYLSTTDKQVAQIFMSRTNEGNVFSAVMIGNKTFDYDRGLAVALSEADVKFNLKDLIDYKNIEEIPLIVSYNNPVIYDKSADTTVQDEEVSSDLSLADVNIETIGTIQNIATETGGEFKKAFQNVPSSSVVIPRSNLKDFTSKLKSDLGNKLEGIYVDSKLQITLDESVPLIRAPQVWNLKDTHNNFINGSGIKIAIVDSGIDCTHADLNKVVAWGDFVNGNQSCYDDNGHGTHVASIAAGTGAASGGKYKGVAPGASLIGAKVCDVSGGCASSWIISGIEFAVNNGADVISMSLGCGPDCRNTPLEEAVKKAIAKNVTVVIAAGNEGPNYFTIATPALVREAIAVGATGKDDSLPYFSSRGPTDEFLVKPDVTASGVYICAANAPGSTLDGYSLKTCDDDDYISLSGTSMATPHVSGLVALIKQAHPDWSPEMIKAALMYAKGLGLDVYQQGAGRIDAMNAVNASLLVTPSPISPGPINSEISGSNLKLTNVYSNRIGVKPSASQVKNILTNFSYNLSSNFSASSVCLEVGNSSNLSFSFNVSTLPLGFYSGFVNFDVYNNCSFTTTPNKLKVPFGFAKIKQIELNFVCPKIFSNAESTWIDGVLFDGSNFVGYFYGNCPLTKTIHTIAEKPELMSSFITHWRAANKSRTTFIVKGMDLTGKQNVSFTINNNKTELITSNIPNILQSKGFIRDSGSSMLCRPYLFSGNPAFSCLGWGLILGQNLELQAAYNMSEAFSSDYTIQYSLRGYKGNSYEEAYSYALIPYSMKQPFSSNVVIPENELKNIEMFIENPFIDFDQILFGFTIFANYETFVINFLDPIPVPKEANLTVRYSASCDNCHYWIMGLVWNSSDPFSTGWAETHSWDGGNEFFGETPGLPSKISLFKRPFSLNVTTECSFYWWWACYDRPEALFGEYKSAGEGALKPFVITNKGNLKVKFPGGQTITTSGGEWVFNCFNTGLSWPPEFKLTWCIDGTYKIDWNVENVIKDQNLSLTKVSAKYSPWSVVVGNYSAIFRQSGIPSGIEWGVTVNGKRYTTTSSSIEIVKLSGKTNYSYDSVVYDGNNTPYICNTTLCSGSISS